MADTSMPTKDVQKKEEVILAFSLNTYPGLETAIVDVS